MGTSEFSKLFYRLLGQHLPAPPDCTVDCLIREALLEDALAQPSAGAWDRLRKAINERRFRKYGMWVLDEPWRDPKEVAAPPVRHHLKKMREYADCHSGNYSWPIRAPLWDSMIPIFPAWVKW